MLIHLLYMLLIGRRAEPTWAAQFPVFQFPLKPVKKETCNSF